MGRFRERKGKGERYNLKKIPQKAEEMTQQVGVLQEVLSSSQNQHVGSLLSVTPVLQDPTSSSGHQVHIWCTDRHGSKTSIHKKIIIF